MLAETHLEVHPAPVDPGLGRPHPLHPQLGGTGAQLEGGGEIRIMGGHYAFKVHLEVCALAELRGVAPARAQVPAAVARVVAVERLALALLAVAATREV